MKQKIKKAILQVVRPIWMRLSPKFYARIDKRIDMRLAQTETGWKQHVPAFLNAVSSVQALSHELLRSKQELIMRSCSYKGKMRLFVMPYRDRLCYFKTSIRSWRGYARTYSR